MKILSAFFLLIYISFLSHDLLAHSHYHVQQHHGAYDNVSVEKALQFQHHENCLHLLENCSSCKSDSQLHQQVFLTQDYKDFPPFILPSFRIQDVDGEQEKSVIIVSNEELPVLFHRVTRSLRGPPIHS